MMKRTILTALSIFCAAIYTSYAGNYVMAGKVRLEDGSAWFVEDSLYWGSGVISAGKTAILGALQTLSNGAAIADIRTLTFEDGSPFIENNRLYYSVTTRTGGGGPAIMELDLGSAEIRMTGQILTAYKNVLWHGSAPHVMYDRRSGMWQITIPRHGADPFTGKPVHIILVQKSYSDVRFGVTRLNFEELDYEQPQQGDEDAQIFYDDDMGKWVMIYASKRRPDGSAGPYMLRLQTSDRPDGGFKDYSYSTAVNATGVTSTKIGGKRYVFSGDLASDGHNNYPFFTFPDLKKAGHLDIDITDGGFRGWNNVTPFPEGLNTRYVFLAFDRGQSTDESAWTYGRLHLYYSKETNPGTEFDIVRDGVRIPGGIREAYGPADLHFLRRSSWNNMFAYDIKLSEINLKGDVLVPNSNMYPAFGSSELVQLDNALFPKTPGEAYVISGIHQPRCNYVMDLSGIQAGDTRYLYIGGKDGVKTIRVLFKNTGSAISISCESGGRVYSVGDVPSSARKARIFMAGLSVLYVFVSDSGLSF